MTQRGMDWIEVVEASYRLDETLADWLRGLVRAGEIELDAGIGAYAHAFEVLGDRLEVRALAAEGVLAGQEATIEAGTRVAPVDAVRVMFDAGFVAGSSRDILEPTGHGPLFTQIVQAGTGGAAKDVVGVVANDGEGWGVALAGLRAERSPIGARTLRRWTRVTAHIGAGLRLRRKLEAEPAREPEAILDADARPLHLTSATKPAAERLREAALRIDRARTREIRAEPEEALSLWRGLVDGRWSLVDRFERDGRRFVVAHRNPIVVRDPRGLSPTEHVVAELVGRGRTTKEIAYHLGVGESAVTNATQRVRRKLGLGSTTELATFFAPGGVRARLARFSVGDELFAVAGTPDFSAALDELPPAEREVAMLLLRGHTNRSIAEIRGTSERTVANQVGSLLRRLGAASRTELAAKLASG